MVAARQRMLTGTVTAVLRCHRMLSRIRRAVGAMAMLAGVAFALPISCGQPTDGVYTGGIEPSPASRVNPEELGFTNDGNHR